MVFLPHTNTVILQEPYRGTITELGNLWLIIIFMEELLYVLTRYFVSCVHVRFYFSLPLIFTLLAANISHFLSAALNFRVFLPTKFVSFVFNNSL